MHPARSGAEQLTIEHKRNPRKRQPVSDVWSVGKSPEDVIHAQAVQNVRIFRYIEGIVVIDKIETADLPEDQQGTQCQNGVNENGEIFFHNLNLTYPKSGS
jgi:hypothetical protein